MIIVIIFFCIIFVFVTIFLIITLFSIIIYKNYGSKLANINIAYSATCNTLLLIHQPLWLFKLLSSSCGSDHLPSMYCCSRAIISCCDPVRNSGECNACNVCLEGCLWFHTSNYKAKPYKLCILTPSASYYIILYL